MFVTVRYGDEKKRLFNADCKNEILLQSIKSQCDCGDKDVVEVSDERGVVKNLRLFPSDYASDFLKERETLVLLTVKDVSNKEESDGERPVFTPLLSSLAFNKDFLETLNPDGGETTGDSKRHLSDIVENEDDAKSIKSKGKQNSKDTQGGHSPAPSSRKTISRRSTKSSLKK